MPPDSQATQMYLVPGGSSSRGAVGQPLGTTI